METLDCIFIDSRLRVGLNVIDKHNLYYEMREKLSAPKCPICNLLLEAVNSFIESLLYEKINDHGIRDALTKSRGFCHQHSKMLREHGNPLAHAILYAHYLENTLQATQVLAGESHREKGSLVNTRLFHRRLKGEVECPLCSYQGEAEERYLSSLIDFLRDQDFSAAYSRSVGVCRPHFLRLYSRFCPRETKEVIFQRFLRTIEELHAELEEIKRKTDYRFAREDVGTERDAWVRVFEFWTGGI